VKRTGPVVFGFVIGMLMLIQHFTPDPWINDRYNDVLDWKQIVFGTTLILGVVSLVTHHGRKVARRGGGWAYSLLTLAGLAAMPAAALAFGSGRGPYLWMFDHVQAPMQATMFALLAFYVASASYRAFRARTLHAALLLTAGVVVMLGRVPLGELIGLDHVSAWILDFPNLAAKRGVMIGVGLGMTATSIKIITGIERTYLGKGA